MRQMNGVFTALLGGIVLFAADARAAVWNEVTQGDISGNRNSPSVLNLTPGSNTITATTGSGDVEVLRLNVPAGGAIESLFLRTYASPDGVAFIGIQQGTTFTIDPNFGDTASLLGYAHFGTFAGNVGSNILPEMGRAFGAQGFTPPLTVQSYTLYIQQLGSPTAYQFDVVATPEPGSGLFLALATGMFCSRRRR